MKTKTTSPLLLTVILLAGMKNVNAQSWSINGNAGTNSSSNFIGTTDNVSFKIRTKNTVRMTITNVGKVGIGTSTPASKLDVAGTIIGFDSYFGKAYPISVGTSGASYSSVGYGLTFTDTTANYRYRLNDFSSMISFIGGGFDFNTSPFGTAGNTIPYTTVMSILQNGKVGIGTTAPMWKLHVVDATSNGTGIRGENSYAGSAFGTGVYGKSVNSPGSGSGVKGQGGFSGVFGEGYGTTFVGTTHGVYGYASGSAGTRTGVYGTAVGGTINYGVYCNGSGVYTGTWTDISDQKFKKELAPVAGALGLINQLNPVSYQLKTDEYPMMNFPAFRQYGFVAQEMEKVIPLLVENGTHPGATIEDKDIEFKTVNYIGMIPILTKAIQELSKENEELKSEVRSQKSEIELIKSVLSAEQQEKLNEAIIETTGKLEQNFPNPFNSQTEIKFQLPAKFSVAQLIIYDSNGKQIRSYDLQTSTSVIIKAGELSAGAYTYSLVIDELVVDSKQMVLTK